MRVWVDCTAAAHPLVLRPIVERLRERGNEVEITAREYGQTVGILDRLGLEHTVVGEHGDSTLAKAGALASRSAALRSWARQRGFELAAGHGSVDLAVVATLLRIPSAQMQDYEHAGLQRHLAFRAARRVLAPDAIPVEAMRNAGAASSRRASGRSGCSTSSATAARSRRCGSTWSTTPSAPSCRRRRSAWSPTTAWSWRRGSASPSIVC